MKLAALFAFDLIACAALLISDPSSAAGPVPTREPLLAFTGVTVIPMDRDRKLPDQTVLVADGRIVRIGPADAVPVPRGALSIDGTGRYLIPGLADMHAHPSGRDELMLNIANGVTYVRVMWGEQPILDLRDDVRAGRIVGPRMLVGSRIVDGSPPMRFGTSAVVSNNDAAQVVRDAHAAGYDFIKIYSMLSLSAYDAVIAAGRREGIPIAGHLPYAVPLTHALDTGLATIEHLGGFNAATAPDGSTLGLESWYSGPGLESLRALGRGDLRSEQAFDAGKLEAIAAAVARSRTWIVPTLAVLRIALASVADIEREVHRPEMKYISPAWRASWGRVHTSHGFYKADADQMRGRSLLMQQHLRQVAALHAAGAKILAGTDTPNPFMFPGFSVHDELALFVQAGLSPYDALRTATAGPAEFTDEAGKFGTVVERARADLVLLDADPLADIHNTRRIAGVLADGRWFGAGDLSQRLGRIAAESAQLENRFSGVEALVGSGEPPPSVSIALRLLRGERDIGAERYAVLPGTDGTQRVIAQQMLGDRAGVPVRFHQVELDTEGLVRRYVLNDGARNSAGHRVVLERTAADAWNVTTADGRKEQVSGRCDAIATLTAADAAVLAPLLRSVEEGATRVVDVCLLSDTGTTVRETWTVEHEPAQTILTVGFLMESKRYSIKASGAGSARQEMIWIGGGHLDGQFMKSESSGPNGGVVQKVRFL